MSFLSDSYPPLINLYKENAFYLDNFYLLKPSFYVISLLRSLLKGYLFVLWFVLEILFVLDKLCIVSLNYFLFRVDILVSFLSLLFLLIKSKKVKSSNLLTKEVPKELLTEVSWRLDWMSKLKFGFKVELIGEIVEFNGENEEFNEFYWLFLNLKNDTLEFKK